MSAEISNADIRRWAPIVVLTILGAVAGLVYALLSPSEYTAKAYVAVVAQNPGDSSAVSYAQAYSRIATQGDALQAAADASRGGVSIEELRRSVRATASPDAPVIEVTGTAESAERAADLVNLLAKALIGTANDHTADTRVRLTLLSTALPPPDPTSPQLSLAVAVGAAAGLLIGGLAFLARGERRETDLPGGRGSADGTGSDLVHASESRDGASLEQMKARLLAAPAQGMPAVGPEPGEPRKGKPRSEVR